MRDIRISKGLCIFTVLIMCIGLLWASVALAGKRTFPGDGYANPDAFGVSGHGPALSYTDNGDGTFTDNNTKFVWEKKLAADGSEGGNCQANQASRSVHCVNNIYSWTSTGTAPDGTLFTEFLAGLNNSAFTGFSDWCIPNVKKLQSIVDYSTFSPASSVPGATAVNVYWSATTLALSADFAWFVTFDFGFVNIVNKLSFGGGYARAVRPCS